MTGWLWGVGAFYVFLGVRFLPAINGRQLLRVLPSWTAPQASVEFKALVDWQWVFGLDLLAIGVVAVVTAAAGSAAGARYVVWIVVARELLGGILPDAWLIIRGYTVKSLYIGFIVVHAVIIATGLALLR